MLAVNVVDSTTPKIDAVRIAYEEGIITSSQLIRNVFESQGVCYFDPGERPTLTEITDKRYEELFLKPLIPTLKGLLNDVSGFYNSQPPWLIDTVLKQETPI